MIFFTGVSVRMTRHMRSILTIRFTDVLLSLGYHIHYRKGAPHTHGCLLYVTLRDVPFLAVCICSAATQQK
jgi:hypothetical protein